MQTDPETHEISANEAFPVGPFGVVSTAHPVPFQASIRLFLPGVLEPAAMHVVLDTQDTPLNSAAVAPAGMAVVWTLQFVPFQRSANGTLEPDPAAHPTIVQTLADGHEIPSTDAEVLPDGSGTVSAVQLVPFQPSANGSDSAEAVPYLPAKVQAVELEQETDLATIEVMPDIPGAVWRVHDEPFHLSTRTPTPALSSSV